MHDAVAGWDTFYVIIGSSAAALTGLMFVVITLTLETRLDGGEAMTGLSAFASPTVVHFCIVLLIAAVLTSPLHTATSLGICVGAIGLLGVAYLVTVFRRIRRVNAYEPVGEDWVWHICLPFSAYLALLISAVFLWRASATALYFVAAASLVLLYSGIHNSWDTATWMAVHRAPPTPTEPSDLPSKS
jgi:hypothetical protein